VSAFSDLIREAENLGVTKFTWDVHVPGYSETDPLRWRCRATVTATSAAPVYLDALQSVGRTGEEALRRIVDFLKRTS
jgi:hypothetical protein